MPENLEPLMIRARKNAVNPTSRLNKHGGMSPRFDMQLNDLEHEKITSVWFYCTDNRS
ncbi:rCG26545 [Rattus norvegicus]|uniref:RCG26545 n=1 Tax=Rattus norvegicus TaxID=10116 RepID=A6HQ17_RAT|nr:rCG26545 [Rattus norvegicus]